MYPIRESSFAQYFKQEGIEEGIEQGIEQGADNAPLKISSKCWRFDLHEADPLSTRIATIEDLQRLKQLLRAAVQVSSLDEFERMLDS